MCSLPRGGGRGWQWRRKNLTILSHYSSLHMSTPSLNPARPLLSPPAKRCRVAADSIGATASNPRAEDAGWPSRMGNSNSNHPNTIYVYTHTYIDLYNNCGTSPQRLCTRIPSFGASWPAGHSKTPLFTAPEPLGRSEGLLEPPISAIGALGGAARAPSRCHRGARRGSSSPQSVPQGR